MNTSYLIKWQLGTNHTYNSGSVISFDGTKLVEFSNVMMPPGKIIHQWLSQTVPADNYHLPILVQGLQYKLKMFGEFKPEKSILVSVIFYGLFNNLIDEVILDDDGLFQIPDDMYSYTIQILSVNNQYLKFESLILSEVPSNYEIKYENQLVIATLNENIKDKPLDVLVNLTIDKQSVQIFNTANNDENEFDLIFNKLIDSQQINYDFQQTSVLTEDIENKINEIIQDNNSPRRFRLSVRNDDKRLNNLSENFRKQLG
jgi:accessory Sec system protein Asp3